MIDSINIGKVVYSIISPLCNKVYPLIAENGTSFPFVVYSRENLISDVCKDGIYEDSVSLCIKVVASTYNGSTTLAQQVREAMTLRNYDSNDMIINSYLNNCSESYEENSYVQTLYFDIKINNK